MFLLASKSLFTTMTFNFEDQKKKNTFILWLGWDKQEQEINELIFVFFFFFFFPGAFLASGLSVGFQWLASRYIQRLCFI
jgi:hypothetical protein